MITRWHQLRVKLNFTDSVNALCVHNGTHIGRDPGAPATASATVFDHSLCILHWGFLAHISDFLGCIDASEKR